MYLLHIWRYHIFPFLDKKSICKTLCTGSKFYNCPKKKKLWEYHSKQHWKHSPLPKKYLNVVKFFHSLENLSMYELELQHCRTNSLFDFKKISSMEFKDLLSIFYNQEKNCLIIITKYKIFILNTNISDKSYTTYCASISIPNIIDCQYLLNENILFVINDKQLEKINITTRQRYFICDITKVRYIIYISDNEFYCLKDTGISILNIKSRNEICIWKPVKNKKIKYGCKPLLTPNNLLVPINNGNKVICIEINTHLTSEYYKRSFDCVLQFGDISDDNIFITLYKKSIEIRNTNNINQVIYRFGEKDIPIPISLTEAYKYNISIIGNYSFIRIHDLKNMIYYGITINLSNYSITEHYNYILKDDISTDNDMREKIFYILPYKTKAETPNMIVVSQSYIIYSEAHKPCTQYIRIVSMKND